MIKLIDKVMAGQYTSTRHYSALLPRLTKFMLLNQAFSLREAPRALFWIGVFLISFFGMFYLGLNPELIDQWYLVLVIFNVIMSLVAIFYIVLSMKKIRQNTQEGVIGSRFTWSFIRIVPILVFHH